MTTVNIAFSGGVESVYLLQMALERGFKVNLCLINVNNNLETRMSEIIAMERIIEVFKELIRDDQDYRPKAQWRFKGEIKDIMHMPVCPYVPRQDKFRSVVTFDVTQQFAVVLGMMAIRREYIDTNIPSVWIGWLKQDAAESSFNEIDFTEADYRALLMLPEIIGPLSNSDNIGVPFRSPIFEMSKKEVYNSLIPEVKEMLIPNGAGHVNWASRIVTHIPYDHKVEEWEESGIPTRKEYSFPIEESSWIGRYVSGCLLPVDVGLEDSLTTRDLLRSVSPFFAKGRTLIRPQDVSAIKSEISDRVQDLIRSAQAMPKLLTEEDTRKLIRESA
jgi:hypothetical protein